VYRLLTRRANACSLPRGTRQSESGPCKTGPAFKTLQGHSASGLKASFITRGMQVVSAGGRWATQALERAHSRVRHNLSGSTTDKVWALAVEGAGGILADRWRRLIGCCVEGQHSGGGGFCTAGLAAEELEKEALMGLSGGETGLQGRTWAFGF